MEQMGLVPFDQKFPLEIIWIDGKPLFNAYQVGEGLLIGSDGTRSAIQAMDSEDYLLVTNAMISKCPDGVSNTIRKLNNRGETFLYESGVYEMIFRSRKSEAMTFKRWLKQEVLPSIIKTGQYSLMARHQTSMLPQNYEEALEHLLVAVRGKRQADERLALQAPMVEEYERFLGCHNAISMQEAAKVINFPGVGPEKLYDFLRQHGVLMADPNRRNLPYQEFINRGWFEVKLKVFRKPGHEELHDYRKTVVAPKGLAGIYRLLKKHEQARPHGGMESFL